MIDIQELLMILVGLKEKKVFVESMSSQARANDELIHQRTNEGYGEMSDEYDNSNSMGRSKIIFKY